jgi:hypothetical protein
MAKWCRKASLAKGPADPPPAGPIFSRNPGKTCNSAFPELLQRSRRDVLERGSRIEARSNSGLFFWKIERFEKKKEESFFDAITFA